MNRRLSTRFLAGLAMLTVGLVTQAETMVDVGRLLALEGEHPADWPVVDARPLFERSQRPIPGALDPDTEQALTGKVLVIGADSQGAQQAARAIEARRPQVQAHVLAGGLAALVALRPELGALNPTVGASGMPGTFTIPKDTCQVGKPVHVFTDQKEAAPAPEPAPALPPASQGQPTP